MLTPEEIAVAEMAGQLFGKFCELEVMHPSDRADVCFHVHAIQSIVMARSAQRAHPLVFPSPRTPSAGLSDAEFRERMRAYVQELIRVGSIGKGGC